VKFAFETSKKMLPTPCTLIRADVLATLGTVIVWVPSLDVLAASTIGNVFPPFVDIDIFTFAQLTGPPEVFATFQVTVCCVPPVQVVAPLGDVTTKGPAAEVTLSTIASELTPPPAARLSRAVTRKFIARVVVGSISPIVDVLFRISESFGKVREGLTTEVSERKSGRVPSSVIGGDAAPKSLSSHE